ncbi:MAG: hypothetical protein ABEH58_08465 [Haloplanus sp.]
MRATDYIYDSERTDGVVEAVLERLADREEDPEYLDVAAADDRAAARREAMLTVRESLRVGENPPGIFDEDGNVDFSAGVLVTVAETGRRGLHVGEEALEALDGE